MEGSLNNVKIMRMRSFIRGNAVKINQEGLSDLGKMFFWAKVIDGLSPEDRKDFSKAVDVSGLGVRDQIILKGLNKIPKNRDKVVSSLAKVVIDTKNIKHLNPAVKKELGEDVKHLKMLFGDKEVPEFRALVESAFASEGMLFTWREVKKSVVDRKPTALDEFAYEWAKDGGKPYGREFNTKALKEGFPEETLLDYYRKGKFAGVFPQAKSVADVLFYTKDPIKASGFVQDMGDWAYEALEGLPSYDKAYHTESVVEVPRGFDSEFIYGNVGKVDKEGALRALIRGDIKGVKKSIPVPQELRYPGSVLIKALKKGYTRDRLIDEETAFIDKVRNFDMPDKEFAKDKKLQEDLWKAIKRGKDGIYVDIMRAGTPGRFEKSPAIFTVVKPPSDEYLIKSYYRDLYNFGLETPIEDDWIGGRNIYYGRVKLRNPLFVELPSRKDAGNKMVMEQVAEKAGIDWIKGRNYWENEKETLKEIKRRGHDGIVVLRKPSKGYEKFHIKDKYPYQVIVLKGTEAEKNIKWRTLGEFGKAIRLLKKRFAYVPMVLPFAVLGKVLGGLDYVGGIFPEELNKDEEVFIRKPNVEYGKIPEKGALSK